MLVEGKGEIGIPAMEPDVLKFSIFFVSQGIHV